jgi:hypothetical protein
LSATARWAGLIAMSERHRNWRVAARKVEARTHCLPSTSMRTSSICAAPE